jgi:hypothetical protein
VLSGFVMLRPNSAVRLDFRYAQNVHGLRKRNAKKERLKIVLQSVLLETSSELRVTPKMNS